MELPVCAKMSAEKYRGERTKTQNELKFRVSGKWWIEERNLTRLGFYFQWVLALRALRIHARRKQAAIVCVLQNELKCGVLSLLHCLGFTNRTSWEVLY